MNSQIYLSADTAICIDKKRWNLPHIIEACDVGEHVFISGCV